MVAAGNYIQHPARSRDGGIVGARFRVGWTEVFVSDFGWGIGYFPKPATSDSPAAAPKKTKKVGSGALRALFQDTVRPGGHRQTGRTPSDREDTVRREGDRQTGGTPSDRGCTVRPGERMVTCLVVGPCREGDRRRGASCRGRREGLVADLQVL
jgi:hypothetical protein